MYGVLVRVFEQSHSHVLRCEHAKVWPNRMDDMLARQVARNGRHGVAHQHAGSKCLREQAAISLALPCAVMVL